MKILAMQRVEREVTMLHMVLPVRYEEEDIPDDFPGRKGEVLTMVVDIDTGRVHDWPKGRSENCYMKVVDGGVYTLLDADGRDVAEYGPDYVPCCVPGEYGDYVNFKIGSDGIIRDWTRRCTTDNVVETFFSDEG
jgi:hypothetical protein